jgi:hypothetical protein
MAFHLSNLIRLRQIIQHRGRKLYPVIERPGNQWSWLSKFTNEQVIKIYISWIHYPSVLYPINPSIPYPLRYRFLWLRLYQVYITSIYHPPNTEHVCTVTTFCAHLGKCHNGSTKYCDGNLPSIPQLARDLSFLSLTSLLSPLSPFLLLSSLLPLYLTLPPALPITSLDTHIPPQPHWFVLYKQKGS